MGSNHLWSRIGILIRIDELFYWNCDQNFCKFTVTLIGNLIKFVSNFIKGLAKLCSLSRSAMCLLATTQTSLLKVHRSLPLPLRAYCRGGGRSKNLGATTKQQVVYFYFCFCSLFYIHTIWGEGAWPPCPSLLPTLLYCDGFCLFIVPGVTMIRMGLHCFVLFV